jgi:lysophospholipase L1-like esterase
LKQVILLSTVSRVLIAVILTAGYAELALRCVVKYLLPPAGRRWPLCAKVHQYFTENPDNLYYSRYVPHPFLQFTGPRGPVPGTTADFYLGFKEIKLSDIPKPSGVIRVACLGGSTTADGYPESLQEFLARSAPGRKFQVLNFGSMWWSSVHSTVNYVLNVIDFKPDYLILHDSCNDHHYRGFPGLRGDCAHAYRLFQVPQTIGETLFRFSLIYRIGRTFLSWLIPSVFRRSMEMKEIGLLPGKTYNYVPAELYVIDRNIRTICTVARNEGSKVCLTTMPLSNVHTFGEEHDKVYRPHTRDVNEIIRKIARETGFPLADFDATMTGREEFFKDAVHATVAGNNAKAEAVGQVILADLKPS